jgi:hypothetical protein
MRVARGIGFRPIPRHQKGYGSQPGVAKALSEATLGQATRASPNPERVVSEETPNGRASWEPRLLAGTHRAC